jgi:transcriptional regulator with XRE-family HTH domain
MWRVSGKCGNQANGKSTLTFMLTEADICKFLPRWRKAAGIKQDVLSELFGVSQGTVSRWETGKDVPSKRISLRLLDAMSASWKDRFALDRAAMSASKTVRASFDLDGVRLLMISQGLIAAWPTFAGKLNSRLIDHLVDESRQLMQDDSLLKSIRRGEVAMVSAISDRHVSLDMDAGFLHQWTAVFRSYGTKVMVEMTYEKCETTAKKGVGRVLYFDEIAN